MVRKNKKEIQWYSLDEILKYDAQYYIIYGERSNGKSYAVDEYIIDKFFKDGSQFGFIKRFSEDIKGIYMDTVLSHLDDYLLEKYEHKVKFYRGKWLLYHKDTEGKLSDCVTFGYAFSLANVDRTKALQFPNIETILFEEFMSKNCYYLPDEINNLLNLVSTIVRQRHTAKVFMLANAISKFSPYSEALGVKLHRVKKGEIITREYQDKKGFRTKFAIQRSENVNVYDNIDNEEKVVFNVFGNSGVGGMITSGDFETHAYPRHVDGYEFVECNSGVTPWSVISDRDKTSFVLRFEDYYYRIYIVDNNKFALGFREIDFNSIKNKNTTHILNGVKNIKGVTNINNLAFYNDDYYNEEFNLIVSCMKQKDFVTISDDDGENVVNGFRMCGITLVY